MIPLQEQGSHPRLQVSSLKPNLSFNPSSLRPKSQIMFKVTGAFQKSGVPFVMPDKKDYNIAESRP